MCSSIDEDAKAYISIFEATGTQPRIAQCIKLISSASIPANIYQLSKPIVIQKNRLYTIKVEVFGGPTHTYNESLKFVKTKHNDLIIELFRDPNSNSLLSSSGSTPRNKDSHSNPPTKFKKLTRILAKHSNSPSLMSIEEEGDQRFKFKEDALWKASKSDEVGLTRVGQRSRTMHYANSTTSVGSTNSNKSTPNAILREEFPLAQEEVKRPSLPEKMHRANLITGISFVIPSIVGHYCSCVSKK